MADCLKKCGRETLSHRKYCNFCYSKILKWIKQKETESVIKGYFCFYCKTKKPKVSFFDTKDIENKNNFLRDKNGKAICFDCYLETTLNKGWKTKSKK